MHKVLKDGGKQPGLSARPLHDGITGQWVRRRKEGDNVMGIGSKLWPKRWSQDPLPPPSAKAAAVDIWPHGPGGAT